MDVEHHRLYGPPELPRLLRREEPVRLEEKVGNEGHHAEGIWLARTVAAGQAPEAPLAEGVAAGQGHDGLTHLEADRAARPCEDSVHAGAAGMLLVADGTGAPALDGAPQLLVLVRCKRHAGLVPVNEVAGARVCLCLLCQQTQLLEPLRGPAPAALRAHKASVPVPSKGAARGATAAVPPVWGNIRTDIIHRWHVEAHP